MSRSDIQAFSGDALADVFGVLQDARDRVIGQIASGLPDADDATDFDRFFLAQRQDALEREIDVLGAEMVRRMQTDLAGAAVAATRDASIGFVPVGVDAPTLALVQEIAASQITKATEVMKAEARIQLQRALAGGLTRAQFIKELGQVFGGQKTVGEIERIVRTETARVWNQSQAAVHKELADSGAADDVIRVWRTAGDGVEPVGRTRTEHFLIDGQERELWQPFNMGDLDRGLIVRATDGPGNRGYRIAGPQDPALPAHLVIYCRCVVIVRPRSAAAMPYTAKTAEEAARRRRRALAALVA